MTLSQLGPYPIEREVGRGGMGVVYLARDPRLHRPVAIKVLPEAFARDPERLARFEREARLLASLTHPNIAGIYGLEEADGKRFLALEFVEGETLAERLVRGPLALDETLDLCRQIAGALEAAHDAGIVHRDLKPGNVKITPTGDVKVLDFGLAKGAPADAVSSADLSESPTVTQAATGAGVILGTAAYMSPEQARGRAVDRRTDIWSFGCVLFECLTGIRAFEGETVSDMIALILQGEPDWSKLPAGTPEKLRALLGRCLEKDARRRLRDIGDARIEIEELQGTRISGASRTASVAAAVAAALPRRPRWLLPVGAVALAVAAAVAGAALWNAFGPRPEPAPLRFTVRAPSGSEALTDAAANAISPDGRTLAFVLADSTGQTNLWVRSLGSFEPRRLPGTRDADLPFWSPDSRQIAFFAEGKLRRIRLSGGNPEVVCDAPSGRGGSWSRRGDIVFAPAPGGPLFRVRGTGGVPVEVTEVDSASGETAHRWPCFLPDAEHFLYAALPGANGQFSCYVGSLRSKDRTKLFGANGAPVYAEPGYLVFIRGEALLAQRFDAGRRALRGDPFPIGGRPATTFMSAAPLVSASRTGALAWENVGNPNTRLVWLDRAGRQVGTVDIPLDRWTTTVISPEGHRALVMQQVPSGENDLWVVDLDRQVANRITFGQGTNTPGAWSPDGREFLYGSNRRGPRDIYRRAADGSGGDRVFLQSNVPFKDVTSWSPDGKWVSIQENGARTRWDLWTMSTEGGSPKPYLVTPFNESGGDISPDGRWLVYISDESGAPQAYVQTFPEPGGKQQVSRGGAFLAGWSRTGGEIFLYSADLELMSVPVVVQGDRLHFGTPHDLFRIDPSWPSLTPAPDGKRFLVTEPAVRTPPGISIAVNWLAGREEE